MKRNLYLTTAILALCSVGSMWSTSEAARWNRNYRTSYYDRVVIPAGSTFNVRLDSKISTEDAQSGDTWTGTITNSVIADNQVVVPAGSPVEGVVTSSAQGTHNSRPSISLGVRRVMFDGQWRNVRAETEPIVAGSNRAKKVGAIVGGAAVGALLGRAVGKGSKGTIIGGLLGGAAGYGLTRNALRTMQLKPGTTLTFVSQNDVVAYRR
jgi:hypothetical protein